MYKHYVKLSLESQDNTSHWVDKGLVHLVTSKVGILRRTPGLSLTL